MGHECAPVDVACVLEVEVADHLIDLSKPKGIPRCGHICIIAAEVVTILDFAV